MKKPKPLNDLKKHPLVDEIWFEDFGRYANSADITASSDPYAWENHVDNGEMTLQGGENHIFGSSVLRVSSLSNNAKRLISPI